MPPLRNLTLPNLTLQKKIGLVVLIGLAVGLGLFSWLGIQSLQESTEQILDERLTIARIEAGRLDEKLTHILVHLGDAAEDIGTGMTGDEFISAAASLRDMLNKLGISVRSIVNFNTNARVARMEPVEIDIIGTDWSQHANIRDVLGEGRTTISGLISTPLMEAPLVLASVPILDEADSVVGALSAAIYTESPTGDAFGSIATVGETGYIEIVDGNGMVLASTSTGSSTVLQTSDHPGRFAELIQQQQATVGTCHRCHGDSESPERRRDVLAFAPLSTTPWGVAVRQAEEEALAPTHQLEQRLLLLGVIVVVSTFLTLWVVMQGVVSPIRMLTAAAKSVAGGNYNTIIPVKRQDDIGQLSDAFRTMTQELTKSRNELVRRNEELSALNSIAATVSQSLNLEEVLESALRKVLEVTRTTAGCVFLRTPERSRLRMMSRIGPARSFVCEQAGQESAECACHEVLREGQPLMVNAVAQCPILDRQQELSGDAASFFISVPLKYNNQTMGIMNIASSGDRYFTEGDFRLLDSIGNHVGLAIENSILYGDTKQKENLRGQILSNVINAQEEERKRIAREVHDEYGQTLTGLLMSIESVESMVAPEQSHFRERLSNLKSVATRALDGMRKLVLDLRPSTLDDLGLAAAVRSYLHANLEAAGIHVDFESNADTVDLAPEVRTALFRIIQEAVHNITKYAEAGNVRVLLHVKDGKITAMVEDDGRGFDIETVYSSRIGAHSLGLLGIQERATLLGGTFNIQSGIGRGTSISVEIPLGDPAEPVGTDWRGVSAGGESSGSRGRTT
jgi:signal transduction histidine kinase